MSTLTDRCLQVSQTMHLALRTRQAAAHAERGLRGARPRDLHKRFRRLLRPSQVTIWELRPVHNVDEPPVRVQVTESHLSLAGRLRIELRQALAATEELL